MMRIMSAAKGKISEKELAIILKIAKRIPVESREKIKERIESAVSFSVLGSTLGVLAVLCGAVTSALARADFVLGSGIFFGGVFFLFVSLFLIFFGQHMVSTLKNAYLVMDGC